jgi:demethylmenaquinone methyltransferase / 2-methoxy-6-polyprenyl-1,4-benzoquinol methylase
MGAGTLYLSRMSDNRSTTDFGFRQVPRADKASMVRAVFDSVAPRYDLMNDLMSLGVHRVWKRILLTALEPQPNRSLLDLAAGTGDISLGWKRLGGGPVLMNDINESMLNVARDRAMDAGMITDVEFLVADAERLPLRDRQVDRVSIAFGLRNCTAKDAALREARRVLKPGGRFFCLEFSQLQVAALAPLYDAWSFRVLPGLGRMVVNDAASYQYLVESIRTFPNQERLAEMLREAGFARIKVRNLSGGIAAVHSGWRL